MANGAKEVLNDGSMHNRNYTARNDALHRLENQDRRSDPKGKALE
jgi:hypothetical protein